jgi:hypothetical protein
MTDTYLFGVICLKYAHKSPLKWAELNSNMVIYHPGLPKVVFWALVPP